VSKTTINKWKHSDKPVNLLYITLIFNLYENEIKQIYGDDISINDFL
jgi:hypothetical protein